MNVFLLLKAKAAILDKPDHYMQNSWDCGTAACIAGWVGRISRKPILPAPVQPCHREEVDMFWESVLQVQKALKLSDEQWPRLVHIKKWPMEFRCGNAVKGATPKERAETAGKRIDRFLETDGRE